MPILGTLKSTRSSRQAVEDWIGRIGARGEEIRRLIVAFLAEGSVETPLISLLRLIDEGALEIKAQRLARRAGKIALKERGRFLMRLLKDGRRLSDPRRMHRLRLAAKRFRYAVEFLEPLLTEDAKNWSLVVQDLQRRLGRLA